MSFLNFFTFFHIFHIIRRFYKPDNFSSQKTKMFSNTANSWIRMIEIFWKKFEKNMLPMVLIPSSMCTQSSLHPVDNWSYSSTCCSTHLCHCHRSEVTTDDDNSPPLWTLLLIPTLFIKTGLNGSLSHLL